MTNKITCATCKHSLNEGLVFTTCKNDRDEIVFHIFHNTNDCLAKWFNTSEKTCPSCRGGIYYNQIGKNMNQLLSIFCNALKLQNDKPLAEEILKTQIDLNDECQVCLEDLPIIRYEDGLFYHMDCSNTPNLIYMKDLAAGVSKIVNKHPKLKMQFTPTPPSFFEKIMFQRIKHPHVFKALIIGTVSFSALLFNHYKFGGESWLLFAVSLPAYTTLVITHQVGVAIIAILNHQ